MGQFQYEWWDVDMQYPCGRCTFETKAKDREHAIKIILKESEKNDVLEIYWETLTLDRKGYQRRF